LLGWGQAWAAALWHVPKQVLAPAATRPPLTIVIDPLGGGPDEPVAYTTEDGEDVQGGDIALALALRMVGAFGESDTLHPLLTRTADIAVTHEARNAFIRRSNPAVVIQFGGLGTDFKDIRTSPQRIDLYPVFGRDIDLLASSLGDFKNFTVSRDIVRRFAGMKADEPGLETRAIILESKTPENIGVGEARRTPDWQNSVARALKKVFETWHKDERPSKDGTLPPLHAPSESPISR